MKEEPGLPGQDQDFEISVGRFLAKLGFAEESEKLTFEPLAGGVSSDIWKVVSSRGEYCVKQALPRLKVAAKWEVSCERSHFEAEWLRVAGGLIVEMALVDVLEDRRIAAAGLDVLSQEPATAGHPLLDRDDVVVSPHIGWLTRETLERSMALAVENCCRLAGGLPLLNRVA